MKNLCFFEKQTFKRLIFKIVSVGEIDISNLQCVEVAFNRIFQQLDFKNEIKFKFHFSDVLGLVSLRFY